MKVWESIHHYRPSNRTFSAWIFRIAHNVVIDHYRANRPNGELSEYIEDENRQSQPETGIKVHFDQKMLNAAMRELKDHYRQILTLRYLNDLSYEEIGYIMNRSQAGLRILQFRALKSLRRALEQMGISELDV